MVTSDGMKPVNVLPRKVSPCTWEKIVEYLNNPVGDRPPNREEMLNPFELSILDGELTADQKDALRIARVAAEKENNDNPFDSESEEQVKAREMLDSGMKPPQIAEEMGISIPEVLALLK